MSYVLTTRELRSDPERLLVARGYRDRRREVGDCVNHDGVKRTHGSRCERCWLWHRYGRGGRPALWQRVALLARELRRIGAA